jgi:glutaredoxin
VPTLSLYGKPGCHLCEEARRVVEEVADARQIELREVDVSLDPVLNRDYGERIPVVEIDGVVAFELGVDERALGERLDNLTP